ncbi:MAG: hypothetical protein FWH07_06240 [Oscillospiraceae bacterium]|nr:hypothetical protein [Oscillospiraceae bacterium]
MGISGILLETGVVILVVDVVTLVSEVPESQGNFEAAKSLCDLLVRRQDFAGEVTRQSNRRE